jgi:hypothetical protein
LENKIFLKVFGSKKNKEPKTESIRFTCSSGRVVIPLFRNCKFVHLLNIAMDM